MARRERRRPYTANPRGFRREHALTLLQHGIYLQLAELALERYADRHGDRFICLGSELAIALDLDARQVANAVRMVRSQLPRKLVCITKHPERRGVWVVELPGFATWQDLAANRADGPAGGRRQAGPGPAPGRPSGGLGVAPARPRGGNELAGGAEWRKRESARAHQGRSPSPSPSSTPSPSRDRAHVRALELAEELPEDLRRAALECRQVRPNVRALRVSPGYLEDEWRRCRSHHARAGTVLGDVFAVWITWLRDPATDQRAHQRRKEQSERAAAARRGTDLERIGAEVLDVASVVGGGEPRA